MIYLVVLLYVALIYIRPGEVVPALAGLPIVDVISLLAMALIAGSLLFRYRPFWTEPLDKYVALYFVAIVLSNPAWGYLQGGIDAFFRFLPVVICYYLIRAGVQTHRQLSGLLTLFVYLNVFLAVNGIVQSYTGLGIGGVAVMDTREGARIRGTGIFNDPNDLGMTLVMSVPFLLSRLLDRESRLFKRVAAATWLGVVVFACYLTNSRGTVLGLGAVFLTYAYRRFGAVTATFVGVLGVGLLVAFGPSRTATISAQEGSAQGRIEAWVAAYEMLRSSPLLGVGFGRFVDFHERAAHNSFAHTIGELGLFGAFCFVGLFFWYFRRIRRRDLPAEAAPDHERFGRTLIAAGIGMVTCMAFLSRQYTMVVYVLLSAGATHATLIRPGGEDRPQGLERFAVPVLTAVLIPSFYVVSVLLRG